MLGPEFSMLSNSLQSGLDVFLSRNVKGKSGEDLIEKQSAEQGLMPVIPDEEAAYGYVGENRHFVECFRKGQTPLLTFEDGFQVVRLLMACYRSAELERTLNLEIEDLSDFVPLV